MTGRHEHLEENLDPFSSDARRIDYEKIDRSALGDFEREAGSAGRIGAPIDGRLAWVTPAAFQHRRPRMMNWHG
jgi:hypothetical protein